PNGEVRTTVFDGVDRVVEEWHPHPITGTPTLTYIRTYVDVLNQVSVHEESVSGGSAFVNSHSIDLEDSSNQYLSASDSASLSVTGDMTIELWAKLESAPSLGNSFTFVSKFLALNSNISYLFDYENNGGTPRFRLLTSANGSAGTSIGVNHTLTTGAWHHLAVVYTASTGSAEFFVDGQSIGGGSGLSASIFDGTADFLVGVRLDPGPTPTAFFDGFLDDVRLWNAAEPNGIIEAHATGNIVGNPANLMGRWRFDNEFSDASGHGNTLSNIGGAQFATDIPYGTGLGSLVIDSYIYLDGFGRTVQKRDRAEGVGAGGLPAYTATDTTYDANGRVEKVSVPYLSPGSALTQLVTSPGMSTSYQYDAAGRVVNMTDILGSTVIAYDQWDETVTNPNGVLKKLGRDAFGHLVRVEEFLSTTFSPFTTSYEWNVNENLAKITDASGNVRNFTYDARGLRITAEDLHAAGDATFGTYSYAYDNAGNLIQKQTPKNQTILYGYDALNRPLTEDFTGTAGTEVVYTYDTCTHGVGRRCSEVKSDFSRSITYDLAGNAATETSVISGASYTTFYAYDQLGTITRITHPDSSATIYSLNESGKVETTSWQESGVALPIFVVSNLDYAPHGALLKMVHGNGLEEMFSYDANAKYRLKEHVVGLPGSGGNQGASNTNSVNLEDAESQYLSIVDTDSLSITGSMTIEAWVKLESQPASGQSFTVAARYLPTKISYLFDYENNGGAPQFRIITSANGTATLSASVNYTLENDAWHHVALAYTASSGNVEFFVDGASIGTGSGLHTNLYDGTASFTVGARNDAGPTATAFLDGLIDEVRVWDTARTGAQIAANRWVIINSAPHLKGSWHLEGVLADASGNGNTLTNSNGGTFSADVPFGSGTGMPSVPALSRRAYTYDPVGNILSTVEVGSGATTTSNYSYDGLDRLLSATVSAETAAGTSQTLSSYVYDSIGNILSVTEDGISTVYTYAGNQGTSYANPHAATQIGSLALNYDKNGNLTTRSDRVSHTWDYNNRLKKVTLPDRNSVFFTYDSSGTRLTIKPSQSATTTYATSYFNVTGATSTAHIFGNGNPVASVESVSGTNPRLFFTHSDHLRSISLVTDEASDIAESVSYTPFGRIVFAAGSHREQRKFTGHEYDAESSYTYAKARYLDTNFGRFLSQDPAFVAIGDRQLVGEKTGRQLEQILVDPQAMNSYAYAKNNPIKFVDPTGEYIESALDVAFIGYDIHDIRTNGANFTNVASLVGDIAGLLLPGITGVGAGIKAVDKTIDAVRGIDKALDVGEATVKGADNVGEAVRAVDDTIQGAGQSAPDFIVSPGGTAFPVPKGATGPTPTRGKGFQYQGGQGGNGLHPDVSGFRMMDPKTYGKYQYPNGYGSYFKVENFDEITLNPLTGEKLLNPSNPWWHIPAQ
ncbi:MAG: LamG-like jellyroll fold domain-containing protein, partial [Patescibacteria group bacterium]